MWLCVKALDMSQRFHRLLRYTCSTDKMIFRNNPEELANTGCNMQDSIMLLDGAPTLFNVIVAEIPCAGGD